MTPERPCGREFTKLVTDHFFRNIDRNVLAAVMHGDGMTHHLGEMVEARDHVLNTRCSFLSFSC